MILEVMMPMMLMMTRALDIDLRDMLDMVINHMMMVMMMMLMMVLLTL